MSLTRLSVLTLACLALASCDMADPERAGPDSFTPPEGGAFVGLDLNHRFGGDLPLSVTSNLAPFPIANAVAYVGGEIAGACGPAPCSLVVDTDLYPEGPNEITLVLQRTSGPDPELGLLNLVDAGARILTGTLIFDQSPPTPVVVTSVEWTETDTIVRWSNPPGTNLNARSVTLLRAIGESGSFERIAEATAIGVDGGHFIDPNAPRLLGQRVRYVVAMWNGRATGPGVFDREVAESETVVTSWAPILDGPEPCNAPLMDHAPGADRFLYVCDDTMWAGTISGEQFTASAPVPALTGSAPGVVRYLAPRLDGGAVYLAETRFSAQQTVAVATVNPSTLAVEASVTVDLPVSDAYITHVVASGTGTVYLVSISAGRVFAVDPATGALLGTIEIQSASSGGGGFIGVDVLITPDGSRLIRAGWDVVQSVALAGPAPGVTATIPVGTETNFAVDGAGRVYMAENRSFTVDVLNPITLQSTGSFSAGEPGSAGVQKLWGATDGVFVGSSGGGGDVSDWLVLHGTAGARQGIWPAVSNSLVVLSGRTASEAVSFLGGSVVSLPPAP